MQTKDSKKVVVGQKLGEGGQGAVYVVDFDGAQKAFKWFSGKRIANPEKFYANLENNIKKGKPSDIFLWPEAITEKQGEAFGYVMDLRPPAYKDFSRFLMGREGFASVAAMTNASLQITEAFRVLHNKGFIFQDLNDGNIFIDPNTGNVLIGDNDSVCEFGKSAGIRGKPRYMAPEVVLGNSSPRMETDLFSLSVILFQLWTDNHPLEGKASVSVPVMDSKTEKKIYGENPVFMFDPSDESNRPVQGIQKGAIGSWSAMPEYLRGIFISAFSKETLKNPEKRIIEQAWLKVFNRMKDEKFDIEGGKSAPAANSIAEDEIRISKSEWTDDSADPAEGGDDW